LLSGHSAQFTAKAVASAGRAAAALILWGWLGGTFGRQLTLGRQIRAPCRRDRSGQSLSMAAMRVASAHQVGRRPVGLRLPR
jgi:hypothetical protein